VAICLSGESTQKKKKKIRPLAAIHPNGQGERDPATLDGHFCLSGEPKKNPASLKNRF
jgi:hypothetical protein